MAFGDLKRTAGWSQAGEVAQRWHIVRSGTVCADFAFSLASFVLGQELCTCPGREHPVLKGKGGMLKNHLD